jgi:hypothetical protein
MAFVNSEHGAVRSWLLNAQANFAGYRVHEDIICGYLGRLCLEQSKSGVFQDVTRCGLVERY